MKRSLDHLGDFTATPRVVALSLVAIAIGLIGAFLADGLMALIGLFTNLFYFHRADTELISPAGHSLGAWAAVVPVIGALIIGLMARYGSERIRGHGIPEALESILLKGSRVEARVALLKPVSAAISIGSGGPFGAEGPIIMTGGAFGSLFAQIFHLTAAERKTLLVAGAAAGMSATFDAPLSSVLLAVELLLFEWKPRSFIPVACASATAAAARHYIIGAGPIFQVPVHPDFVGPTALAAAALCGLLAGGLSAALTRSVYAAEDAFQRLPFHWMWWPAIGGVAIGLGGLIEPRALGVGYETIEALLQGKLVGMDAVEVLAVKWGIWAIALGSGTSGGVLAPLLMMGAGLGALEAGVLPDVGAGFWPMVSMAAILGGTMRSPLTGVFFALELTHDYHAVLPLIVAVTTSYAFTVLVLKRSILTEKVARRGFHVTREYAIDPLEVLFVEEVMRPAPARALVDGASEARSERSERSLAGRARLADDQVRPIAHEDETLRAVVHRMAETGHTELLVVRREAPSEVIGEVTLDEVLEARLRHVEEETRRERVLPVLPSWLRQRPGSGASGRAEGVDQGAR